MDNYFAFNLDQLPFVIIALILAFTVHEFAHAIVAHWCGDSTPKNMGRLTLSPVRHLDPIGTILLLIAGFGWARPVLVDRRQFKHPHLYSIFVSIAGPLSNLLLATLTIAFLYVLAFTGLLAQMPDSLAEFVQRLLSMMFYMNVMLFVFNLLPVPPLDGYRILEDLAPDYIRKRMIQYEYVGVLVFLVLLVTPLKNYTLNPILSNIIPSVMNVINQFVRGLFT
ncbi:membrane metalloprotease [Fictibacillus macauensis ZFHKF-1]|uniref:Membrane metalloprotease n=1 Tax=Fictibacillus macauensis ZFHKF-1 TaxID=1196324 RepID=I8AJ59_9BACL|nr:site-2 protease family protein [Fictibacillus macauensis]EIT85524.1 membrane metalloprotease [Fictibacillus macauensis ZFHKF-1]